jgi:glycosyltransferase involved in cell wall biosynthesis
MKFLFYDHNIPKLIYRQKSLGGGSTVQSYIWIKSLIDCNHTVGVLVDGNETNRVTEDGVILIPSFLYRKALGNLNWIYYKIPILFKAIKKFRPDVIYQSGAGFITFLLSVICIILNIKFIHRMANDVDSDKRIKCKLGFYQRVFYRIGLRLSSIILCQNEYQFINISSRYKGKIVKKIHNPYTPLTELKKIKSINDRRYVAWLGMFQYQKNLTELLNIVEKFPKLLFVVAGESVSGIDLETQKSLIQLKACKNVDFIGYVNRSEISSFLSDALFLLNTSRYEGFSNTFLESFDCGTPVVCLSKVDPDHIIQNNKLGLTCDSYSNFPSTVKKVLSMSGHEYSLMSYNCTSYIKNKHNSHRLAQELTRIISTSFKI